MKFTTALKVAFLIIGVAVTGCSKSDPKPAANAPAASKGGEAKDHSHGNGPDGGVVFDLGKYHAEFTVDHPKHECTILVLGTDEKTPTAVDAKEFILNTKETKTADGKVVAPMTITMSPANAADGKASKFVGSNPGIGNVADFAGTVSGEIEGKPAMGEFAE